MKKSFLKNMMPIAIAAIGVGGAFVTTSMQTASKSVSSIPGFTLNAQGNCNVQTNCETIPSPFLCNISGSQAYAKDAQGNCIREVYRP